MKLYLIIVGAVLLNVEYCFAQKDRNTTPVPILKQINKHNEDGSYSYGYEAADGTFKIETKYPDGEVYGKYGYVDDTGKLREIEYGASKRGFEPNGNDIQVPPPTLKQNPDAFRPLGPNEIDDGQYREDPSVYYKNEERYDNRQPQRQYQQQQPQFQPQPQQQFGFNFNWDHQPQSRYQPQQQYYRPQYYQPTTPAPQPAFRPQTYYNPSSSSVYPNWNPFQGHPATNVDIWTGSYSVNYRR